MRRLFGTDGIRGIANRELTPELAYRIGRSAAYVLQKKSSGRRAFFLARDTRISGTMLEGALAAGITSVGVDVYAAGVISTPAAAYLTREMNCCGGVVISASHNPYPDNGIKFFSADGYKLSDETEEEIEELYFSASDKLPRPESSAVGRVYRDEEASKRYLQHILSTVTCSLEGYRIVLDCANGAVSKLAPQAFRTLGAQVIAAYNRPNGSNINEGCGSTHPEALLSLVRKHKADFGFTFDGDADRVLAADSQGRLLDGDIIMTILARDMLAKGVLQEKTVVATVMSNLGLDEAARNFGFNLLRTKVGDRYVLAKMLETGACLGGEQSGHIILLRHNTTGDGLLTALHLSAVIAGNKQPLEELASSFTQYPQVLVNCPVARRDGWDKNARIREAVAKTEQKLNGTGRLLIRPSGTEPLIRIMLEGRNEEKLRAMAGELAAVITEELS